MKRTSDITDLKKLISETKLPSLDILVHKEIVRSFVGHESSSFFEIEAPCLVENSGIVPLDRCRYSRKDNSISSCHFIPAAGASSRYLGSFLKLWALLPNFETEKPAILSEIDRMRPSILPLLSRLPPALQSLFNDSKLILNKSIVEKVLKEIETPKALMPYDENQLFLERQLSFSGRLNRFNALHIICPLGYKAEFSKIVSKNCNTAVNVVLSEQDETMSTVRFDEGGKPFLVNGKLAIVPAGHGMLSRLLTGNSSSSKEKHKTNNAKYSFIQNIDNVLEVSEPVLNEVRKFLDVYEHLLDKLNLIRSNWEKQNFVEANLVCSDFIEILGLYSQATGSDRQIEYLIEVVFATSCKNLNSDEKGKLLLRPFNILAQVPNTSNNVGGLPLFVKLNGERRKICVEGPHISPKDSEELKQTRSAKFFNPVLVCAESGFDPDYYLQAGKNLAIVSEKQFRGKKSLHCEYVLYELLGNSAHANVIFVGVSSELFRPHKSILDRFC